MARADLEIDIAVLYPLWDETGLDIEAIAKRAINSARAAAGIDKTAELSIALMSDDKIAALNRDYRGKDKPTNVLSFPADHPDMFGDIALSLETLEREAGARAISLSAHFTHLLIHGFLHLCGYDHVDEVDAAQMENIEIKALAALDLPSPYA